MKLNTRITDDSQRAADIAVELMRLLPSLGDDVHMEIDGVTGVSVVHPLGAFGASSDMPDDVAKLYLSDGIASLKEYPPIN